MTDRLVSLFLEANQVNRTQVAQQTSSFVDSQLEETRRKLAEQEQQLEEYRVAHAGTLPTQVQTNLAMMTQTQESIQNLANAIEKDRDRQALIQQQISDIIASRPAPVLSNGEAASVRLMRPLRLCVGAGESLREHPAELSEQFLLMAGRQVLPPRPGRWGRAQARGGAGKDRSGMVQLLRRWRDAPDRSGPGRARPTDTRPPLLYPCRQRLCR